MVQTKNLKTLQSRMWVRGLAGFAPITAFIFLTAGRLDYAQGWIYLGLNILIVFLNAWVLAKNTDLIQERLKPGQGIKTWDKRYFAFSTPMYFLTITLACLDGGRYGWTRLPPVAYGAGLAVYGLGQAIFLWAKWANNFFATVVRIQTDRGQTVCRTGPYRWVRHPGYVGGILFGLSMPLVLGSLWGLIPAALAALALIVRTRLEDSTLQEELPGYREYTAEVRYRLVPGVW